MAQQNGADIGRRDSSLTVKKDMIIRHVHGAQIRANPSNHQYIDHKGGEGDWSKWSIHYEDSNKVALIQNQKTRKYLTIDKKATEFLANGEGTGVYCRFKIHHNNEGQIQLESMAYPGLYLSVRSHEGVVIETQANVSGNYFHILTHGVREDDTCFTQPYQFQHENIVIIRHPHNAGIAVIQGKLSDKGTKDTHSHWLAIPQLSPHPHSNPSSQPSQSSSAEKSIVADVDIKDGPKKLDITTSDNTQKSDHKTNELLDHNNNNNNNNHNTAKVVSGDKNVVSKNSNDDKKTTSIVEEKHADFIQTIKLRHEHTQKYLAINEAREIELINTDTDYALFKVHVITKPNVVKLESWKVSGAFIDVKEGGIMVGKGGPHSQVTILRKQ
ncbi:hypothetical protein RFI_19129 [Reticulomyxa filosa]|uniref:Fascin domain-containing protein n=1 Tax=Reticulomyxa filosa TaxID=46433 RepID=X6MWD8_RETFI|nr:hypothetical protein RFI_19129 [Reticulomyxa filosa]|eukprot:ETO18159.1 hypothetical protein RFI_19129 [Reticulomyxa filosa]